MAVCGCYSTRWHEVEPAACLQIINTNNSAGMVAGLIEKLLEFGYLFGGQVNIFIAAIEQVAAPDTGIMLMFQKAVQQSPVESICFAGKYSMCICRKIILYSIMRSRVSFEVLRIRHRSRTVRVSGLKLATGYRQTIDVWFQMRVRVYNYMIIMTG